METLLIILAAAAAILSALTYPRSPKCTVVASVMTAMIGASALLLLVVGPEDYLLHVPSTIAPALHPYVLGSAGMLLLIVGAGGIIGPSARRLLSRKIPKP
jgi:hypothetical protein